MRASGGSGLGGGEHGVDAKLVDRIEWNGEAHISLLRLVDDVGGVDAIVGKVVVVSASTGKADRALAAAAGIDGGRLQRGERGPIAAIERQFFGLHLANAGAERIGSFVNLLGTGRHFHLLLAAGDLEGCVQSARPADHLLDVDERERLEALMVKRDRVDPDR